MQRPLAQRRRIMRKLSRAPLAMSVRLNFRELHRFLRMSSALAGALLVTLLAACDDHSIKPAERAAFVRTETVKLQKREGSVTLTGVVQARFSADLSFRATGRVVERLVDVGAHVRAGDLLARLDPTEQQA